MFTKSWIPSFGPTPILPRWVLLATLFASALASHAQGGDNGIHVADAKVYDDRQLTIMMDSLNKSLQGISFINQGSLATALGNIQGYQNTDSSFSAFANGAVGPQAAAVFANNLPAAANATPPTAITPTSPTFTVNVNPPLTTTTGTTAPAAASPTGYGPAVPTLPTLQTPPTFNPQFGPSSSDLLTDETNLTYQIFNLSMLLNRSLTDRIVYDSSHNEPRLQAVVGFDIDLEPNNHAQGAVAVVEIAASMRNCPQPPEKDPPYCDSSVKPQVVAMMPEQGSHNAAALSQKANAFGGALAAQVFSVGLAAQKRSQTFYLYRDIDTLSFQKTDPNSGALRFGWEFRPVLGRPTVEAGLRHMIAVLSLPASDTGDNGSPALQIVVTTHWERYDSKAQTKTMAPQFCLFSCVDEGLRSKNAQILTVPKTYEQYALGPEISNVKWVATDSGNGVAIITGSNFFPGTTVRLGNKTYTGNSDGLTLKSDKELELSVPISAAVTGGVISGRYGIAKPLVSNDAVLSSRQIVLKSVSAYPEGPDDIQLTAKLIVYPPHIPDQPYISCTYNSNTKKWSLVNDAKHPLAVDGNGDPQSIETIPQVNPATFEEQINSPRLLLNGIPVTGPTLLSWYNRVTRKCDDESPPGSLPLDIEAIVPAKDLKGSTIVTVVFPFEGDRWTQHGIYYQPAINIARIGSSDIPKLIITSNNPGDFLCKDWRVQLDQCEIPVIPDCSAAEPCKAPPADKEDKQGKQSADVSGPAPFTPVLHCIDAGRLNKLALDISSKQLAKYKQLLLVHHMDKAPASCDREHPTDIDETRLGDIPEAKVKPQAPAITKGPTPPSVQQYTSQAIKLEGTHLDQIKTVLFDQTKLAIVNQDAGSLTITIPLSMTKRPANHDQIELLSDQNDPVPFNLDVTANPASTRKEK